LKSLITIEETTPGEWVRRKDAVLEALQDWEHALDKNYRGVFEFKNEATAERAYFRVLDALRLPDQTVKLTVKLHVSSE